ncbi:histidine phosphatase family protein [soil metagenome]
MKALYLLRHAKSSHAGGEADHDRPLAERGRRAAPLIAEHMRRQKIAPALVLCSSARRTRETLDLLAPALGDDTVRRFEDGLYQADAAALLERLRQVPHDVPTVMLVGHNPAVQEMALTLAGGGADVERLREKFPTAALATLAFDGAAWHELAPGDAELTGYVTPADLG